ncbi:MAG: TRAP transporter substrate-binding protein DctP [Paracoccaceae bacterium]
MTKLFRHAAGLCLAGLMAAGASQAAADTINLRISSYAPAGNFINDEIISGWMDRVVADSEGTITYQLFPGGTSGRNPAEQLRLVQDGIADIAFVIPGFTPGAYDGYGVIELPGLAESAVEASMILGEAYADGLLDTPDRTRVLGVWSSDMNRIHLRAPIASLADMSGHTFRANGVPASMAVRSLGGAPVTGLTSTEVAEGLSRGTIDGAVMGSASLTAFRGGEITTMHIRAPMGSSALMLPINLGTWNKLPDVAKAAFEKHGGVGFSQFAGEIMIKHDDAAFNELVEMSGHSEFPFEGAVAEEALAKLATVGIEWVAANPNRQAIYDHAVATVERLRGQ